MGQEPFIYEKSESKIKQIKRQIWQFGQNSRTGTKSEGFRNWLIKSQ